MQNLRQEVTVCDWYDNITRRLISKISFCIITFINFICIAPFIQELEVKVLYNKKTHAPSKCSRT